MILKAVKLKNIRTYNEEVIEFDTGSTLLAGDIGSGKSTILLSIEFGLFGLQKGEITGSDLLRHGSNNASVELYFDFDGRKVVVGRSLKREKKGITQETGFIEIDGKREIKSPNDLKAIVLQMIGYPQDYLTKNPIMFRYTVYTPQDDMKRILTSDDQERLNIIRKIFDIDKYGRIRDNASSIIVKELRSLKRQCEIQFSDIDQKIKEKRDKETNKIVIYDNLSKKRIELFEYEKKIEELEKEFEYVADQIKNQSLIKEQWSKSNAIVDQKKSRKISISTELNSYSKKAIELKSFLEKELSKPNIDEKNLIENQKQLEAEKSKLNAIIGFLESELRRLQTVLTKGMCEFCGQNVSDVSEFRLKVSDKQRQMSESKTKINNINIELKQIEQLKQSLIKYNSELMLRREREKNYQDVLSRLKDLESEQKTIENDIEVLGRDIANLSSKISNEFDNKYKQLRLDISSIRNSKESISREVARIEQQIENIQRDVLVLTQQIADKEKAKEKFNKLSELITWFDTLFIPLTESIEKHVLSTIQHEFNQFFQQWFDVLIPDQTISVTVDDGFTPVIEQGGYQTEYQNLSGGEKTSVALAYRLALNKVINTIVESIKTKDLIILDEPTDGFSTDQIDRLRDVIQDLGLKQMLIVSHEPKIDTYVDNVIRFYKEGNVSRVVR